MLSLAAVLSACPFGGGGTFPPPVTTECFIPDAPLDGVQLGQVTNVGFEAYDDQTVLPIEYGFQGGQHVLIDVLVGLEGIIEFRAVAREVSEIGRVERRFQPCPSGEAHRIRNLPVVLVDDRARRGVTLDAQALSEAGLRSASILISLEAP